MNLWRFVIAGRIEVIEHCQKKITAFLKKLTRDDLFKPETWASLTAFVKLVPDGDILPCRSKYSAHTNAWQIALNHVHDEDSSHALWFSLPDVVASVLLTGRIPKIIDAFRLEAVGTLPNLLSCDARVGHILGCS